MTRPAPSLPTPTAPSAATGHPAVSAADSAVPTVRVLVVDDHPILATSLAMALDAEDGVQSIGVAPTVAAALEQAAQEQPDVVLLDHRLPDGDGVSAIPGILAAAPATKIVMLTASTADHVIVSAIEAGATGCLSKTRDLAEVVNAIRSAANGDSVLSPEILLRLLPRLQQPASVSRPDALTEREREVLELVAEGLTNRAIGTRLGVSPNTVRNHIANLSGKLGAHSKLEALSIAVREGLLPES